MANISRKLLPVVALGMSTAFLGCTSLTSDSKATKKDSKSWFSFKKEKEYQIPQNLNVVWTYDILTVAGKPPTRGFGGRIYFYNEKTQAIPVDGELMIYGFDDSNGEVDERNLSSAAKRYKFTAEQLTSHFTESQLGASYSVWVPWDAAPGDEKKIMLIPTFIAKDGRLVRGASATVNLPGKKAIEETRTIMQVSNSSPTTSLDSSSVSNAIATSPAQSERAVVSIPLNGRRATPQLDQQEVLKALERLQAAGIEQQKELQQSYANAAKQLQVLSEQNESALINPAQNLPNFQTQPTSSLGAGTNKIEFNPYFQPPKPINLTPASNLTPNPVQVPTIGFVSPNGSNLNQAQPANHSLPNGLQAPAGQFSQPIAYPIQ